MPLMTGVLPPLQQRDAFELTVSHADFDALVAQLVRLNPPCLLFDAPDTVFPGSALHRRFYERLRSALPAYDKQAGAGMGRALQMISASLPAAENAEGAACAAPSCTSRCLEAWTNGPA